MSMALTMCYRPDPRPPKKTAVDSRDNKPNQSAVLRLGEERLTAGNAVYPIGPENGTPSSISECGIAHRTAVLLGM